MSGKIFFRYFLFNLLIPSFIFLISGCSDTEIMSGARVCVRKTGNRYSLYKDNVPFIIKGAAGFSYLKELKLAGGNTIRTYDTTDLGAVLDSAFKYNLFVIAGLQIPNSRNLKYFYGNEKFKNSQYVSFRKLVERYRQHPALLAWCVGNEVDFPFNPLYKNFYDHFNSLVRMVKETDRQHPVTTTILKRRQVLSLNVFTKGLDFISINIFGKLTHLEKELETYRWIWNGPYLISEWGPNGYWEIETTAWDAPVENTSTKKAEIISERIVSLQKLMADSHSRCLGSLVFYWGEKQEKTATWFSLYSEGKRTETVNLLSGFWKGNKQWEDAPKLEFMLVNGKGAKDNIIVQSLSFNKARIKFKSEDTSGLSYKWNVYPEELKVQHSKNHIIPPIEGLFIENKGAEVYFKAPQEEGAYRLSVIITDTKGNCATANTPFYVLKNE